MIEQKMREAFKCAFQAEWGESPDSYEEVIWEVAWYAAIAADRAARAEPVAEVRMTELGKLLSKPAKDLSVGPLYAAPPAAPVVPEGWAITRCDDGEIVITHNAIGGVVVNRNPIHAREIPEEILWALADAMLTGAGAAAAPDEWRTALRNLVIRHRKEFGLDGAWDAELTAAERLLSQDNGGAA